MKAISWYVHEHELKLTSTGAYPIYYFGTKDGQEQGVGIEEIVSDYETHRRQNIKGRVAS